MSPAKHERQKATDPPFRPKYGITAPRGWTVTSFNKPCFFCGMSACLTDPRGNFRHPGCTDYPKWVKSVVIALVLVGPPK